MASSSGEVERVRKFRPDPLVKGFKEQEQDELRRLLKTNQLASESPWGVASDQDSEYRFGRFEVLYRRPNPTPFEAEKLLKKLATDPGIIKIMKSRKFGVCTLCELDPEDADQEQAEKGEGNKCLLGWNRNFGERIALRLRTNDFVSFRKYDSIVNTLIHELTHNVFGPHDEKFWGLFNDLKHEYGQVHASRKAAKMLGGEMAKERGLGIDHVQSSKAEGRLGGSETVHDEDELREARLRALEKRSRK